MTDELDKTLPPHLTTGVACTRLLAEPASWINRRVETIELLSHEETRRRVSIDFTLSLEQFSDLTIEDGVVIPISVLTKEPRRNFDLRDESGRAVPVLGKQQNGELAHTALVKAAFDALPDDLTPEVFATVAADLRQVVLAPIEEAREGLEFLNRAAAGGDRWRAAIIEDSTCQALLHALVDNYVLFAVLAPGGANRRILKYSYGEDFNFSVQPQSIRQRLAPRELARRAWAPDRKRFVILCPGADRASSFHAEIVIPEELRVDFAILFDFAADEPVSEPDRNVNRASLYASREIGNDGIDAFVEIAPERTGTTFQAAATSIVVTSLLWVGVESGLDAKNPGAAVSILLAGAALFSGISAVRGEHRLVKSVFKAAGDGSPS